MIIAPAAACSSGNASTSAAQQKAADASATITPTDGSRKVRPDKGVQVTASGGSLEQVTVQGGGRTAEGRFSADKKTWRTLWALKPGTAYTVTAIAKNANGRQTTTTGRFTTLKASSHVEVGDVTPRSREKVGVGMPIMVNFDRPISARSAVEQALEVRSTTPVEGAWYWVGNQQVIFRPRTYWPARTTVMLVAHLTGVRVAPGTYGTSDLTRTFTVGPSHVTHVNLKTHRSKVYVDGRLAKTIKVSGGMGGADSHGNDFRTTSGIHLAMGKLPQVWMTSPNIKKGEPGYYHELVLNDVQISNSGEYLHRSPGEFECLGRRNCSHGCVRQAPSGAAWFFRLTMRGDVIKITGTSRDLAWNNGWGYWQLSWKKWVRGSALDRSVTTTRLAATGGTPSGQPTPAPGHS